MTGSTAVIAVAVVTLIGLLAVPAVAATVGGFEIDADQFTPLNAALYSNTDSVTPAADWAGNSNSVFVPSTAAPHTAATDCYGSNVDFGAAVSGGAAAFICDGNSDPKFRTIEPEENVVSPSGKSPDDQVPVKPGNVRPKNDFSHAYATSAALDSPCDADSAANNIILRLGGHRGDHEGDAFWGFEFDSTKPGNFDQLEANDGSSFTLDMNRHIGDIFVSFTVTNALVIVEVFKVTGFQADGDAIFTKQNAQAGCPASQPQGFTRLATNDIDDTHDQHDVTAPPWNIPVCDPTADNSANTCRLANGTTPSEDLIAYRDFAEASVDLTAFGITNVCFTNVLFTSRSAHVLEGADVQDIGGADFPLCGKKAGEKFEDLNGNGAKDTGEPGVANWPITLYQDGGTIGVVDGTDASTAVTTNTDANGNYEFLNLAPGNYIACEGTMGGWTQSFPSTGTGIVTCPNGTKGYSFVMSGADHLGNDFGNFRNATVSGVKFKDKDDDGAARESGEPGLAGWEIHLFGTDGRGNAVHLHDTTDDGTGGTTLGAFSFSVPPGTYTLCETLQTNWVESYPSGTGGVSCTAHSATVAARGWSVTVTSNGSSINNFGNSPLSTVTVTFNSLVTTDGTTPATHATAITCTDKNGNSVGGNTNNNTFTTNKVRVSQSPVSCSVTYVDP